MNKIVFPLKRRMVGPQVADLQDALQLLLERGLLLAGDEGARRELLQALQPERAERAYGGATAKLVARFQEERGLPPTGEVDAATAEALNALLKELGLLDGGEAAFVDSRYTVLCRALDARGQPIAGLRIELFHEDPQSPPAPLGEPAITDATGLATFRFKRSDFTQYPGEQGPTLVFKVFRNDVPLEYKLPDGGDVVPNYRPQREPIELRIERHETIRGIVITEYGVPAENLRLRLYRREFGGKVGLLAETTTQAGGLYAFAYDPGGGQPVLEVHALKADGQEIALTKPLSGLTAEERGNLNLVVPADAQPLEAEYHRLIKDLTPHVGQIRRLAEAKENAERQDLTVLHRATGWDARLIALTAISERLAGDQEVGLPADGLYGLLRAGLPWDKLLLAQVEPDVVEEALKKVRDAGIVALDDNAIAAFKEQFAAFSNRVRLNLPAPGSAATYGELLKVSGLEEQARVKFGEIFLRHRGDGAQLWEEAKKAGLSDAQIGRLQLQGKLAYLAGNSAAMTKRLLEKNLTDPVALVEQDFHRAEKWKSEVFEAAGIAPERRADLSEADRQKLAAVIPAAYAADTVEARLDLYAEDMARKLRLSYPTHTLARRLETEEAFQPLAGETAAVALLKNAAAQGFRLGEKPVAAFLREKEEEAKLGEVKGSLSDAEFQAATRQLQTLHRLYQITPDDESMPVLQAMGITSAHDVMAYPQEQFIAQYEAKYFDIYRKLAPAGVPQLIYRKAQQVSAVIYNLFTIVKQLENNPPTQVYSPESKVRESVKNTLIKRYPTLETLFGSMDFCECEHCRSVLSPAAYFVDLLQFVDIEDQVWSNFLAQWEATHGGEEYPHKDGNGKPMKPYDVLIKRRPDLPHIPLTCENTHTVLPYIDVVNEILEYYVANNKLAKDATRDTGTATTAELLAEPQYVIQEAYDALLKARYPLTLPFDRWLATVRAFCDYFETPLQRLLEVFRPTDALFDATKPDRAAIFIESLGLAPAEAAIFTDLEYLVNDNWHALYGYPSIRSEIKNPNNPVNSGDATLAIPNADAGKLALGLLCTFFDQSSSKLSSETKAITAIGEENSGGSNLTTITLSGSWKKAPKDGDLLVCDAPAMLKSAKALSRRLGVTYKEITEIVQTGFVNPQLQKLAILYKLGVSIADALFYKQYKDLLSKDPSSLSDADKKRRIEVEAFEQRLHVLADEFKASVNDLKTAIENIPFDQVLVLADPDASCNFDLTTLQYANGNPAQPLDFLRINLFVRLWRKLGWSIEETDRALTTFIPAEMRLNKDQLPKWLKTALIYLAHLKELEKRVKVGKRSREKLLTLWADIPTTGRNPLYAQLFLTKSVLKTAPVFDHPLGEYLKGNINLESHLLALQGALGLTADDITAILADAPKSNDGALSLANVSLLYRYGLLAKGLKLTVRELIALKQLSGLDPFKRLNDNPLQTLEEDHPFTQTLAFVEAAEAVKDSGLKIEDLDYLLRHRFDPVGPYRPNREATLALIKALAEGIRAIRAEHAVPEDPGALSDEVLQQKLGLMLPPDVVTQFMAMLNGTAEFTAVKDGVGQADSLPPAAFAAQPAIREVAYNSNKQRLTLRGVLFDTQKNDLKAAINPALNPTQQTLFAALLDKVQQQARDFFDKYLLRQTGVQPESGFLGNADYDALFAPLKPLEEISPTDSPEEVKSKQENNRKIEENNYKELQNRRYRVAQAFLPLLQERLIRQFIVQTLTAQTGADSVLVESLVTDQRLLQADGKSLLVAFAATAEQGVNAAFFDSNDFSGDPQTVSPIVASADTGLKDEKDAQGNTLNAANSAQFDGYLEVATPGAYRFFIELEKNGAKAKLRFAHLPEPVFLRGEASQGTTTNEPYTLSEFLELKPGVPYRFTLELKDLNGGYGRLLVQGETLPKGPLSQLKLYPANAWDAAERALLLLRKSLQLVQTLALSEREVRYLLTHAADFGGVSLSELPTEIVGDTPAEKTAAEQRFARFRRLAAYARLKREMAGGTEDLIAVFEANGTAAPDKLEKQVYPLIARITRRDETTVKATAELLFGASPAFASEQPLERLWEALQIVERFGVPAASLKNWTGIVDSAKSAEQRFEIARDLRDTIKARLEDEAWLRVAQPIFDKLRQQSRDALVAHVMHQHGFDRMEQLYEYFLIDPGMEPVVQTSRIRLAIASVQLFIQRCLLNLEPKVHPSLINSKQWEWMKRYRVWEANRKIFLFPENWLEPEFRDDKTHLFTELEGALLQGDVSSDLVEDAFLNYLKKLDELARLDIVAMHIEDNPDPARRVLHVFGRTYSVPHKYFYRRYKNQMWTPWEPVSAQIEGDHLAPVVWRDRLYLFWVTFMEKAKTNAQPSVENSAKKLTDLSLSQAVSAMMRMVAKKTVEVYLHWSEYVNGQWTTRESGELTPVITGEVDASFTPNSVFIHVSKEPYDNGEERGVFIHLGGAIQKAFYLAGRNSAPEKGVYTAPPTNPFSSANAQDATRHKGTSALKVSFKEKLTTEPGQTQTVLQAERDILGQGATYTLLPCDNDLLPLGVSEDAYRNAANPEAVKKAIESGLSEIATLMKPVFYQDNRHTFFVEPSVTEKTIEKWEEWVPKEPEPEPWWPPNDDIVVIPAPKLPLPDPGDPWPVHPDTRINPVPDRDWLINLATVLQFDDVLVGPTGWPGLAVAPEIDRLEGPLLNVNPASQVSVPVAVGATHTFERSGLAVTGGGLNIVGSAGLNAGLAKNINELNRSGLGASMPGAGRLGR